MGCMLIAVFYLVIPYFTYQGAMVLGCPRIIGWMAAVLAAAVSVFAYVRIFERIKYRVGRKENAGSN